MLLYKIKLLPFNSDTNVSGLTFWSNWLFLFFKLMYELYVSLYAYKHGVSGNVNAYLGW